MPKDLSKEKSGSEPYKKKREIFTTSKIDFYIAMKGWQLNLHILENFFVNCFSILDEQKLSMNRKHSAFKRVNEWLEKYYKDVNTEDFDKDGELNDNINIDISDSEKSIYKLENFVVNDSEKNYYCPDCKEYCYSEFHICVSRYEFIFNQNSYINDNNMTQEYNTAVKEFKDISKYNSKYLSFLNSLDSIKKYGFSSDFSNTEQQIRTQIDMNINLIQQKKHIIDKYEEEIRLFSICLLKRKIEKNDDEDNHSVVSTLSEKEDIKTKDETKWKITNQKIRY
ncbi:40538_t:CDS:2 [Gigaspora margarita]|uniref:40538_t:CDS:1 n=1 Tax=Gigaspora margarita TaxID=4874 RepID=A0ABN7WLH1_GIGMA|nr:40538_t:CDS:2 [Gigaspora margarita]